MEHPEWVPVPAPLSMHCSSPSLGAGASPQRSFAQGWVSTRGRENSIQPRPWSWKHITCATNFPGGMAKVAPLLLVCPLICSPLDHECATTTVHHCNGSSSWVGLLGQGWAVRPMLHYFLIAHYTYTTTVRALLFKHSTFSGLGWL